MPENNRGIPLGKREFQPNPSTYIAQSLKEQGVEVAFGVHGGHVWQIVDEMSNAGIKIVTVRHEQAAVYAAEAYAKVTGRPGVAFATAGPGTSNIVSGVQQAFLSCSPVVILLGGNEYEHDRVFTSQMANAEKLMSGITKWTQRLVHPTQFKHLITRAFKDSQDYPKGPVVLEFSLSALWQAIPPLIKPGIFGEHTCYIEEWRGEETRDPLPVGGSPRLVEQAVKLLYAANRPVIFAGDGLHWSGGSKELIEFAGLARIPVHCRRIARGAMPEDHPLCFSPGFSGKALDGWDMLLALGLKVGSYEGYGRGWPKCIQVNESSQHIWTFLKTALGIVGSPNVVLQQMIDYAKTHNLRPPAGREDWIRQVIDAHKTGYKRRLERADKYGRRTPIHHAYLARVLWDVIEERYHGRNRIVIDGWTMSDFAPSYLRARYSGQIMNASEQAGIGHGIGMAIGAAFADPHTRGRPVVALMGDSGVGLAGMDIETAIRFRLPIVFLVNNNNGWVPAIKYSIYGRNWEAMGQQDQGIGQECLPDIRYDKMFEILGCHGEWVTGPEDISPALGRAFEAAEAGKTAVVNVKMDPTLANSGVGNYGMQRSWAHVPWDKLPKRGKALRRNVLREYFPWSETGVPEIPMPDIWEPVSEEEMQP